MSEHSTSQNTDKAQFAGQHIHAVQFAELPYGVSAVAVCHDESGNQECDTNMLVCHGEIVNGANS
ncbi:DUF2141 domain-containing protein [Oleiphilus messinensis]|uniref:DUF2141 domain-containing protein n=1 Tax=Oleiphilus messinensis TaxID=141451 RepID=UPI0012FAB2D7